MRWNEIRESLSRAPLTTREEVRELEDALTLWGEGEMHRAEPHLLRLARLANQYRPQQPCVLYRCFGIGWGPQGFNDLTALRAAIRDGVTVTHENKTLESWSHSLECVQDFLDNWDEPGVIFKRVWEPQRMLIDMTMFNEREQPHTNMDWQEEVIVQTRSVEVYRPEEIIVPNWEKARLAA